VPGNVFVENSPGRGDSIVAKLGVQRSGKNDDNHHGGVVLVAGLFYGFTKSDGGVVDWPKTWSPANVVAGKLSRQTAADRYATRRSFILFTDDGDGNRRVSPNPIVTNGDRWANRPAARNNK